MVRSSYKIATVLGIPIHVHISLLILLPFLVADIGSRITDHRVGMWLAGLLVEAGLLLSICLHELGHSVVALSFRCRVRQILLLPIGGAAQLDRIPTRPSSEFLMAIAGPAVSLCLAAGSLLLASWLQVGRCSWAILYDGLSTGLSSWFFIPSILVYVGLINTMLVLFNLLPSFPMDGGRVLRALLTPRLGRLRATLIASRIGRIMAVLFAVYGLYSDPKHWTLVAIAIFIYIAAGNEYRMVQMEALASQQRRRGAGHWPPFAPPPAPPTGWSTDANDDRAIVSPPPYDHGPDQEAELREERQDNPFGRFFGR